MKIGYSSRWLFVDDKEMNIFEELKYASSLGFEVFGLNLDRKQNRRLKNDDLIKLKKLAVNYGMKIIVRSPHHLNTSINSKELIKSVRENIRIAKLLGSDRLMIHAGHMLEELELDFQTSKSYKGKKRSDFRISQNRIQKRFEQLISNLKKIVSLGRQSGVKIVLENSGEYYQFGSNIVEYYKILKEVRGLKSSISTGHANISGNNVYEYISKCMTEIINLDLHDNHGEKDEHLPLGEGNIDFKSILLKLKSREDLTLLIDTYKNDFIERSLSNLRGILKSINS
ncbi:MAG: TIM barrel protein [Candidatus Aenigmarchaeota archaeon]|nr:TIM barrel protein [Candidatus Aenigmarchaeota archaeon]NIP40796.1 TIM barrel protein [Candidatus Aenigmarchaeota archaeon]NIQ17910.1 TIM barrel protein [Candidatus Aenigmarchaeota archaeon]NIS73499.1 TIM barrel protein [Candidatus Aenigmarchaeota archaeon]